MARLFNRLSRRALTEHFVVTCLMPWTLFGCRGAARDVPIHRIKGRVVNGRGEAFAGGAIEFRRIDGKQLDAIGEIQQDGTFSVVTIMKNDREAGLAEGEYRVVVSTSSGHAQVNKIFSLDRTVTISGPVTELDIIADIPLRHEFRSPFTLQQMLVVLKSDAPGIYWHISSIGGKEFIAGRFPPNDGKQQGDGVRILYSEDSVFVAEDWASVFRDRNPWPKKQSIARLLKALRATETIQPSH